MGVKGLDVIRDGSVGPYLGIETILLKYCEEILKTPLRLLIHIMEGRVKILEKYPKSEEIISFFSNIFMHLKPFIIKNSNYVSKNARF